LRADRLLACALVALGAACSQQMADQPRCDPLRPSAFFADGKCAQAPVEGTVARGSGARDRLAAYDPQSDALPVPLTAALLARGRARFDIYCSPCHDRTGSGNGIVVQRGYTRPTSYHVERLRQAPLGHFVDVMTKGWGAMPSYGRQVAPGDRWAIAAYIRALQRSQHATLADVPAAARARLAGGRP
jgi:mono/diheme cytochrome c family protein